MHNRVQEEAVKLWVQEGDHWLRIDGWHMRVLEHRARQAVPVQVQQT